MADLCSLTVAEARAILIADGVLDATHEARGVSGQTFGLEEGEAWRKLVESASARVAAYERPVGAPTPYPGGNLPDPQTLFVEAVADSEARGKTHWRLSTVSTKMLVHAFHATIENARWSLCGMVQLANTTDFDPMQLPDRCKSCERFARKYEVPPSEVER